MNPLSRPGESNGNAKLTDKEALLLSALYEDGAPLKDIAARFGLAVSYVSSLAHGKYRGLVAADPRKRFLARKRLRTAVWTKRFWSNLDKHGAFPAKYTGLKTRCWIWHGTTFGKGYGVVPNPFIPESSVHRIAWYLTHGEIPHSLHVLHKCDVMVCGNPDHLFTGSNQDNVDDMVAKGRQRGPGGKLRRSV